MTEDFEKIILKEMANIFRTTSFKIVSEIKEKQSNPDDDNLGEAIKQIVLVQVAQQLYERSKELLNKSN